MSRIFVKKKKDGKDVRIVAKEVYLRDDIPCGYPTCPECYPNTDGVSSSHLSSSVALGSASSNSASLASSSSFGGHDAGLFLGEGAPIVVLFDTNIFFHHADFLQHPDIRNVVVLQTVLDEVKHRSMATYAKLKTIMLNPDKHFYLFPNEHHRETHISADSKESPNDRNDRAIRKASKWYAHHLLNTGCEVYLVSNDRENRRLANEDKITCVSIQDYVQLLPNKDDFVDMVTRISQPEDMNEGIDLIYEEHKSQSVMTAGLKSGHYVQGKIRFSRSNVLEAFVGNEKYEEILIPGRQLQNRAVEGDVVAVEVLPKEKWRQVSALIFESEDSNSQKLPDIGEGDVRPTGKVVGIIRKGWRPYSGVLQKHPEGKSPDDTYIFIPVDPRIPNIRIKTMNVEQLYDMRIVVSIDSWESKSKIPFGHFVRLIGPVGEKDTETEVLLVETEVPYQPFSRNVVNCLPDEHFSFPLNHGRTDLRHLRVFSIDPPGCTDIDDALHVRRLTNGNLEIGVHIADVAYFVKAGTAIDEEASNRCTSVYLVDRRIDMLPPLLGTNLCSLHSNVDRYAFSVIWEMTDQAEIVKTWFGRTLIRSSHSFTYGDAQMRLDIRDMTDPVTQDICNLYHISEVLRKRRMDVGALTLASSEAHFQLDEDTKNPTELGLHEMHEANYLIEEFMLLANIEVAKKIYQSYPAYALLRRHPSPRLSSFDELLKIAKSQGIEIDVSSSKALSESLDRIEKPGFPLFNKMFRMMATRCMSQAVYFCAGSMDFPMFHHYGLAAPIYTHFTSPIRRYADVIVHRQLAACIGIDDIHDNLLNTDRVERLCQTMNFRNRMAQNAGRNSVELFTCIYFRMKTINEEGIITKLKKNGFFALIPRYGIECSVSLLESEWGVVEYNPDDITLKIKDQIFRVFDKVQLEITVDVANERRQQLSVRLCSDAEKSTQVSKRPRV